MIISLKQYQIEVLRREGISFDPKKDYLEDEFDKLGVLSFIGCDVLNNSYIRLRYKVVSRGKKWKDIRI